MKSGDKYGQWTVIAVRREGQCRPYRYFAIVKCKCGTVKEVNPGHLRSGRSQSCGCIRSELVTKRNTTHGYAKHGKVKRLYRIWCNMLSRCTNRNVPAYANYGGRGISVCHEWLKFEAFRKWAEENGYEDSLTIDRVNNNEGYRSSNCRWVTMKEQRHNQRRCGAME